jgi:hypothetical protein
MKKKIFAIVTLGILASPLAGAATVMGQAVKPMDNISYAAGIRCGDDYQVKVLDDATTTRTRSGSATSARGAR